MISLCSFYEMHRYHIPVTVDSFNDVNTIRQFLSVYDLQSLLAEISESDPFYILRGWGPEAI